MHLGADRQSIPEWQQGDDYTKSQASTANFFFHQAGFNLFLQFKKDIASLKLETYRKASSLERVMRSVISILGRKNNIV